VTLEQDFYKYLISGIFVASDHPIGFLEAGWPSGDHSAEVVVRSRDFDDISLAEQLVSPQSCAFEPLPGLVLKVDGGAEITIYRSRRIADRDVDIFLLGSAWGVLCHQRGLFPLHCSAVACGGDAYAFVARSGGGKSTLAASLSLFGLGHVCDDVAIADTCWRSGVRICGMPKGLKLWQESAEWLGLETRAPVTSDANIAKYYVDPPSGPNVETLDLKAIYVLEFAEHSARPRIHELNESTALKEIYRNVYRVEWLGAIGGAGRVLSQAKSIAGSLPVFRFSRSRDLQALHDSSSFLAEHIRINSLRSCDAKPGTTA